MPEAGESIQVADVNWDAASHEVTFFVLYAAATVAQIWHFKLPLLRADWATFGRQLAIVFVAAILASLIIRLEGVDALGTLALALTRVVIFAMVIGPVLIWTSFRTWRRGRSR